MNKVYKSVWNESIGAWVAVSENSPARGKRSSRLVKSALASAVAFGAAGEASASVTLDGGVVVTSPAGITNGVAIGAGSSANADYGTATGPGAKATGVGDVAMGADAKAYSASLTGDAGKLGSVAVGSNASAMAVSAASFGALANASGAQSTAIGSHATASATASTAIGMNAVADRANTVSIGNSTTQRQLVQVARGTQTNDAVNVSQLTPVLTALGGKAAVNADGSITAPAYSLKGTTYNNVGDALTALADSSGKYFHANSTLADSSAAGDESVAIGGAANAVDSGDVAIGRQSYADGKKSNAIALGTYASATGENAMAIGDSSVTSANRAEAFGAHASATAADALAIGHGAKASVANSIALGANSVADRVDTVSVGSAAGMRQITNVANGTQANDAVNVSQLQSVTTLLGGGAALKPDGTVTAPAYAVAGTTLGTVGAAIAKIDSELGNKVTYDAADKSRVTLGGTTALTPVALSNVKAGALSAASTDAVNGSQLFATNTDVSALKTFTDDIKNGGGIKYFHTNSKLADSAAAGMDSVAIGGGANASSDNAVALGSNSVADRPNSVSVGAAGKERQITNVAAGMAFTDAVNVQQLNAISDSAVKYDTNPDGTPNYQSVNLGGKGAAKPTSLTNLKAADLSATSTDAVNGSQLFGTNQRVGSLETFEGNINNGGGIKYFHTNSKLADSSAAGADSVAIGGAANASAKNAVALGSNSIADRDNSVSVGAQGKERQITNVAAGTASTDAVNVGQLTTVSNNLDTLDSFAVKYDTNTDGTPNYEQITLGGASATKPTLLTNLANGKLAEDSTDAVNGSQLYATNQDVAKLQGFTNNINNGGGITFFHTNSKLADSSATGADSVAIGGAAVSSGKNAVALGSNSVADRDNTVSVGAAGSERQVTNVAAGTAATDAANVGQLNAVSNNVTLLGASAIKYDTNPDGTPDYANATLGNGNTTGTALHNVAAGTSGMDAVNLAQVNDMIGQVTNIANGAYNPLFTADGNRDTEVATSSGTHSVASGANAVASGANAIASGASSVASGANAIAVGANASASGANALASGASSTAKGNNAVAVGSGTSASADNGVAVGANASATANNAVALGSGSVADRDNSVSIGSQGNERQITNVAPGVNGTDAVNMNQLRGVQQSVNNVSRTAYSGIAMAGALAGLPQVEAGKSFQISAGAGAYANYAALAVGASARLTQNTIVKLGASATNGSHVLVNAGMGYSW